MFHLGEARKFTGSRQTRQRVLNDCRDFFWFLSPHPAPDPRRAPPVARFSLRLIAVLLAAFPITLLLVASRLVPSSAGLGTHQQLGLPPCSMRVIFGLRCPSCGMTTSWAYFMNGLWSESFQVNSGGFLLAIYSLAFALFALRSAWTGQPPTATSQRLFGFSILVIAAVTLVDWTLRLAA